MPSASDDQPVLSAADLLAHRRRAGALSNAAPPESVILVYPRALFDSVTRRHPTQKLKGFYGDVRLLKRTHGRAAVAGSFGLGAPVTALMVEDLAAFGARRFVALGLAGGLQPGMKCGDPILGDRAWRDEGVSGHYLAPGPWAQADPGLVRGLGARLAARGLAPRTGPSWTSDTPYRELRRDVERHQRAGVLTVEMEAAALFAVAQALGLQAGAAFAVADTLADGRWSLAGQLRPAYRTLEILFACALEYLTA
jgi:purine-nucleoside phosphorylase